MPGDQSGDQAGDPSDNLVLRVINIDGSPCAPFDVDRVTLGPAQRVDLEISDASQLKTLLEISTGQTLEAASFTPVATVQTEQTRLTESRPYYPQPNTANAKLVDIHMQGGAMGNLSSAIFEGEMRGLRDLAMNEQKLWAFNGHIGGYDHILAEINLGEVVVVRVWNDSAWPHSMHLHGQHFWVNSREFGTEQRPLLRDTYLMQPREKADLVFVADNPGMWLFHCHMLEHHASGMGGVIAVS
jgi:FtsP/CotA-like multicopper oxidase with cupredoxin domain